MTLDTINLLYNRVSRIILLKNKRLIFEQHQLAQKLSILEGNLEIICHPLLSQLRDQRERLNYLPTTKQLIGSERDGARIQGSSYHVTHDSVK